MTKDQVTQRGFGSAGPIPAYRRTDTHTQRELHNNAVLLQCEAAISAARQTQLAVHQQLESSDSSIHWARDDSRELDEKVAQTMELGKRMHRHTANGF